MVSGKCFGLFGLSPKILKGLGRAPLLLKSLFVGIEVVGGYLTISGGEVCDELVESEISVSIFGVFKDLVIGRIDSCHELFGRGFVGIVLNDLLVEFAVVFLENAVDVSCVAVGWYDWGYSGMHWVGEWSSHKCGVECIVCCKVIEQTKESSGSTAIWAVNSAKVGLEVSVCCSQGGLSWSAFHFGQFLFQELFARVVIIVNVRGHDGVWESNEGESWFEIFLVRRGGVPGELLLSIEVSMSLDDKFS